MTDTRPSTEDLSPEERNRVLATLRAHAVSGGRDGIAPRRSESPPAASITQRRLWLLDQMRPGLPTYNEAAAWRLVGDVDVAVLEDSLSEIVRRHESLRTTFAESADGPVQVIGEAKPLRLQITDLTRLPGDEQQVQVRDLTLDQARRPFDLARGPLLRMSLLRLAPQEHVLVLVAHHIITDGWSIALFRHELATLYDAFSTGGPSPLPDLPVQYADFADWQRNRPNGPDLDAQLDYWRRQLADLPPLLQLPLAAPRPGVPTHDGAREPFTVPADLGVGVARLARENAATPFMVLLAAFQTLLHRYTNESDIAVGTALAGRERPELEQLIGFFANTVVLRTTVRADATFRDILARTREAVIAAQDNQDVPFDSVVDALKPDRSPSFNPLFQIVLVLESTPPVRRHEPVGLEIAPTEVDIGVARYDLTLQLTPGGDAFDGVWEYSTDLFDRDGIRRLGTHFLTLLEDALTRPDQPIGTLSLVPAQELETILHEWNATDAPWPQGRCIHELVEEQATRSPDSPAVVDDERSVSYDELNRSANRLARVLRRSGVEPGALVAVSLRPSVDMLVAVLAVLKAGAAYLPMDPAYGTRRLDAMIERAAPVLTVTDSSTIDGLPAHRIKSIVIDRDREAHLREDGDNLGLPIASGDLAYVIFTSGSTGEPKGVMATHDNVVHSTTARWTFYDSPPRRYLLVSSLSFDSSVAGIFWTLTTGGALVIPPAAQSADIPALCRTIATSEPTHLLCVPSHYELILEQAQAEQLDSLTTVIVAGEPLRQDLVDRHLRRHPAIELFSEYGTTETTVWSTAHRCGPAVVPGPVPAGRPIANTSIYVVDQALRPVPIGVIGEVCIGGAGVTRGYLGQPEVTADRFVDSPFGTDAPRRLYRTGDTGRYLPDGTIQVTGRIDEQIKIRGYRVEPGEIETALLDHPAVDAALVGAPESPAGHRRLVANVVLRDTTVPVARLREFLHGRIPQFAVPSLIVVVGGIPRLPNGKLDRSALVTTSPHAPDHIAGTDTDAAAGTDLTAILTRIWQEVLARESVGIDDNFFEIGGDSLSIVKVYNTFRSLVDGDLTITDLIKYPTIRQTVDFLDR